MKCLTLKERGGRIVLVAKRFRIALGFAKGSSGFIVMWTDLIGTEHLISEGKEERGIMLADLLLQSKNARSMVGFVLRIVQS